MTSPPSSTISSGPVPLPKSIARSVQFRRIESFPVDWPLRVCIRSIVDERYKFSRYFSFRGFNTPTTLDALRANNDLELYDLRNDPDELVNLAADFDANRDLIATMNAKLNALIAAENSNREESKSVWMDSMP